MRCIDLHTHSTASDGSMAPDELVRHAEASGLAAIALTDHDVVDGLDAAVAQAAADGFELVPGVELSVASDTETHILGYYIDARDPHFLAELERAKEVRMQRNYEYTANLAKLGFDVSVEEAAAAAGGGIIARAHFARVMVEKGYAKSVKQAFDDYLANGRPGYSSLQYFSPEDAVRLIKSVGGVAYVAHLNLIRRDIPWLRTFLSGLKAVGLDGVEGYYTEYTDAEAAAYRALAAELGLGVSGGTDFHAANKPHIKIGYGDVSSPRGLDIPYSVLEDIKARRG